MRRIDALLSEYGESHRNETNKAVHWVCVPVIVWAVLALVHSLPAPGFLPGGDWMLIVLGLALLYYLMLSPPLAVGMALYAGLCWALVQVCEASFSAPVWQVALALFVLAWIGQFWGHKIEGKKPSFLKDVQFLLIGPAWLLSFLYRRAGIPF
jgi:uncharacterized membrane protein YGL010W